MNGSEEIKINPRQLIKAVTDSSLDCVFCKDTNLRYTYVNSAMLKLLNKKEIDVIGKTHIEILNKKTAGIISEMNKSVLKGKSVDVIEEFEIDKKIYSLHFIYTPMYDEKNELTGIYGVIRNVTEREVKRKEAENELKESEERYRKLTEISSIGIVIHDKGRVIAGNRTVFDMFGYTMEELEGKNAMAMIIAPESMDTANEHLRKDDSGPYEIIAMRKDGTRFPVEVRASSIKFNRMDVRIANMTDITKRKEAEHLIHLQRDLSIALSTAIGLEEILSCLIDHALKIEGIDSAGIYLLDKKTGALELVINKGFSEEFIKLTNYYDKSTSNAKLVMKDKSIFINYPELKETLGKIINIEGIKGISIVPFKYKNKIIGCFNLASHVHTEFTDNTKKTIEGISGFIGGAITRAQTEEALRESEERLRHSDKMQAIGELAGGIAHDFNNQLAGIVGYADLLREELKNNLELKNYANNILVSARRASDLISQLLAFARKGKYQSIPVNLHSGIMEVTIMLKHSIDKRINIKNNFNADPPYTLGDPTQIQNALLNLALNARDAMPAGGELLFNTELVKLDEKYCELDEFGIEPGDYIQISISDTGIGMEQKVQKRMFEPFFTTKGPDKGTGMGLAAVYGTIKNHKGTIKVYSEINKGTVIHIFFPLNREDIVIGKDEEIEKLPVPLSRHIILVDDEDTVCEMAGEMLRKLGYRITICNNGKEAVEFYKKNNSEIDLIILDMIMPVMNGLDTFIKLKNINSDVKVLLSSGFSINEEAQKILQSGARDFIQKPYRRRALSRKIIEILKSK